MKTYIPYQPDQIFLMPPSLRDWLPEGHLAYFISDVVDSLDLSAIMEVYEDEERGYPPYHPVMMTKVLLYAYCIGVPSSRKIAQRLEEDVAFRVLAANNRPDFRTVSDFRKRHLVALEDIFEQVLMLCQLSGLVKLGHVVLDSTKIKANASKHKAMSYGRMGEREQALKRQVRELLARAEAVDADEDLHFGQDIRGDELPKELRFREERLKKIREAKAALEAEAVSLHSSDPTRPERPRRNAQWNFTDPESRIMKGPDGMIQAYNAQVAVDASSQVIVAARITNCPVDKPGLPVILEQVEANCRGSPREISADAGFCSEENLRYLERKGIDGFIATRKERHTLRAPPAPRGRIPRGISLVARMERKLRTRRGRLRYSLRKQVVEPVFGQIKQARGFRQFLLRGIKKVQGEWGLICITHNLLKLYRTGFVPA